MSLANHATVSHALKQPLHCLLALFYLLLSGCPAQVFAQSESINYNEIVLYLPVPAKQYAELLRDLRAALDNARLTIIKLKTAEHWQQYQQAIREGRRGIIFAAPHYAAWAIREKRFRPLLRLSDELKYVIAVERSKANFFEINDLAGAKICTQRALNLDYLLVGKAFEARVKSAVEQPVWSVSDAMQRNVADCDAYSVSDHSFEHFELNKPNEFIRLQQGRSFSNYAFVAHPRISTRIRNKLTDFLTAKEHLELLKPLYANYSQKQTLIVATKQDYSEDYADILRKFWK